MDPDPDLTIILLGNSGVGKSASGNTILGQTVFESKPSFKPVTKQISEETGDVFGKRISVIDTPEIFGSEEQIKTCCEVLLQSSRPCLFLLVTSVSRFSDADQKAVESVIRVLGEQGFRNCCLLFTGGDVLNNMLLDDFILEDDEGSLQKVVQRFGRRYHLFNNQHGGQEQVRELLEKSDHLRTSQQLSASAAVPEKSARLEDRRIVLLGRPGAGKSSSGNTILGSRKFRSDCDFGSVSTETFTKSAEVEGRLVTVVDTPGFTDEVLTPEQLYEQIMKTLVEASPGPHAFVIVVRIGKMSAEDIRLFETLPTMFGTDCFKYTMVLFTHRDALGDQSLDNLIQSSSCMSQLVSKCGWRYCVFDNTQIRDRQQVRDLLDEVDKMVTDNGRQHYTSDMFVMAETCINEEDKQPDQSGAASDAPKESVWRRVWLVITFHFEHFSDSFKNMLHNTKKSTDEKHHQGIKKGL